MMHNSLVENILDDLGHENMKLQSVEKTFKPISETTEVLFGLSRKVKKKKKNISHICQGEIAW